VSSHLSRRWAAALGAILVGTLPLSTAAGSVAAVGSATTVSSGTDALAIAMDPSTYGGSVAFDATRGDNVSASIVVPDFSVPERLFMTARTPCARAQRQCHDLALGDSCRRDERRSRQG